MDTTGRDTAGWPEDSNGAAANQEPPDWPPPDPGPPDWPPPERSDEPPL